MSTGTTSLQPCAQCGARLPVDSTAGLCAACLVRMVAEENALEAVAATNGDPATFTPRVGLTLGDYRIEAPLGEGGMGVVYRARQISLNRIVALKMLPFGRFAPDAHQKRFRAEAEAIARLRHANIVTVFEIGEHEGQPFLSMEFVEGPDLARVLHERALSVRESALLVARVARAIHYAHERGIAHRDLKPSNILVDAEGQPRVTDFGLAKNLASDSDLTLTGQAIGSPHHIPPEQAHGKHDAPFRAGDVYGLGAILYHLLTRRPPFIGETVAAVLQQVASAEPLPPRMLNPDVPRDLETICLKCLEKDATARYATAGEFADEIERFLRDEPIRTRPIGSVERAWRWCRRRPAFASLSAGLLLALSAGLATSLVLWQSEQRRAEEVIEHLLRVEIERAEDMFERGDAPEALARLAWLHRAQPENLVVAQRIVSALTHRNFLVPASGEFEDAHEGRILTLAVAGNRLVTATNGGLALTVWNTARGLERELEIPLPARARVTALSNDARRLAVVLQDRTLQVWDIGSARGPARERRDSEAGIALARAAVVASDDPPDPAAHAGGHTIEARIVATTSLTGLPTAVQFDPAGARVLAVSEPTGIELVDASSGSSVLTIADAHFADFSPDGGRFVSVAEEEATVRDAGTLEPVSPTIRHRYRILTARFSPDSTRLLTASGDLTAAIWNATTGERIGLPFSHSEQLQDAIFSPDGQRIVTETLSAQAQAWDAMARVPMGSQFPQWRQFFPALFSPDGFWFLSHYEDRLWIRDAFDGRAVSEPLRFAGHVSGVRFLADGRRFVISGHDGRARLWSVLPGDAAPVSFRQDYDLLGAGFTPDGSRVVTFSRGLVAQTWSASTGQPIGEPLTHSRRLACGIINATGNLVVTADYNGFVRAWDASSGALVVESAQHAADITAVALGPDARQLAAASSDGLVRISDVPGGAIRWEARHAGAVRDLAISRDGITLISAGDDSAVRIWSLADGAAIGSFEHAAGVACLALAPHDATLAAGDLSGSVRFWDLRERREAGMPLQHGAAVVSLAFSRDGRRLVTASVDQTARIWDVGTRKAASPPLNHGGIVAAASFSPDGRHVLTASHDGAARVWDAFTGQPASDALQHGNRVVSAQWAPDGRSVLTASWDGSARRWAMPLLRQPPPAGVLGDLAEVFGGLRLAENDVPQRVGADRADALEAIRTAAAADADLTAWCDWLLADRERRPLAPGLSLRAREYVSSRLVDIRPDRVRELLRWTPMNATGLARWSLTVLNQNPERNRRIIGEAGFAAELAVHLDKGSFEAWWSLAAASAQRGDHAAARAALVEARTRMPTRLGASDQRAWDELEKRLAPDETPDLGGNL